MVTSRPVINVLRNALFLLVLVVSRPSNSSGSDRDFGFKALKPILQAHDDFLECLVERLSSADHVLCGNALRLVSALMRDAMANEKEGEWPKIVERLQALGVTAGVERLMRGDAMEDLAGPILEFQDLTKELMRRWRAVRVDFEREEIRDTLEQIHAASLPPAYTKPDSKKKSKAGVQQRMDGPIIDAENKWRRLGFRSEIPADDFEGMGYLGLMDLTAYVRRNRSAFRKALLEQSVWPEERRCPLVKISLSTTMILYNLFRIESVEQGVRGHPFVNGSYTSRSEQNILPPLLKWENMHTAMVNAYLRLWKAAGAASGEFYKIEDLLTLVASRVIGGSDRKRATEQIERQMDSISLEMVRQWQLEDLDSMYNHAWGSDLQ